MKKNTYFSLLVLLLLTVLLGCQVEVRGPEDWADFEYREQAVTEPEPSESEEVEDADAGNEDVEKRQAEFMARLEEGIFTFEATDIEAANEHQLPYAFNVEHLKDQATLKSETEEMVELYSFRFTEDHFMFVYIAPATETDSAERVTLYLEKIGEPNQYAERETGTSYEMIYP